MPKVTVIMPSLNVGPYIRECIDSVVKQTLADIEILCVDAGSTDGTLEILQEYAEKDSRIRLILSDRRSYGYQVNLGMDQAAGEYVGIVETDDYIDRKMYAELYEQAVREDLEVIKGSFHRFSGEGKTREFGFADIAPKHLYGRVLDPARDPSLLRSETLYSWAGIYKRSFLLEKEIRHNETPGASYQDNGFWFQVFTQAHRVKFTKKPYYYLRRDNPGSSFNSKAKVYCMCEEYDFIRAFLKKDPELEKRFAPTCALFRMKNYDFTFNRVAEEYRREFLRRYAEDFRKIEHDGELRRECFTEEQWNRLHRIMDAPERFYFENAPAELLFQTEPDAPSSEEREAELRLRLQAAETRLAQAEERTQALLGSRTFRAGRALTWLPRKVRGAVWCIRDHGVKYTLSLLGKKIRKSLC